MTLNKILGHPKIGQSMKRGQFLAPRTSPMDFLTLQIFGVMIRGVVLNISYSTLVRVEKSSSIQNVNDCKIRLLL